MARKEKSLLTDILSIAGKKGARGSSFKIILAGKTGAGKSHLVNALMGEKIAKEGHELDPCTDRVQKYTADIRGVKLTVWDTPGLQDGKYDDSVYLRSMKPAIEEADLLLYCIAMNDTRAREDEFKAIEAISSIDNGRIWGKALFGLTFANHVLDYNGEVDYDMFVKKQDLWKNAVEKCLRKVVRDRRLHTGILFVPIGHMRKRELPTTTDWISDFWVKAYSRTDVDARLSLLTINKDRFEFADDGSQVSREHVSAPQKEETEHTQLRHPRRRLIARKEEKYELKDHKDKTENFRCPISDYGRCSRSNPCSSCTTDDEYISQKHSTSSMFLRNKDSLCTFSCSRRLCSSLRPCIFCSINNKHAASKTPKYTPISELLGEDNCLDRDENLSCASKKLGLCTRMSPCFKCRKDKPGGSKTARYTRTTKLFGEDNTCLDRDEKLSCFSKELGLCPRENCSRENPCFKCWKDKHSALMTPKYHSSKFLAEENCLDRDENKNAESETPKYNPRRKLFREHSFERHNLLTCFGERCSKLTPCVNCKLKSRLDKHEKTTKPTPPTKTHMSKISLSVYSSEQPLPSASSSHRLKTSIFDSANFNNNKTSSLIQNSSRPFSSSYRKKTNFELAKENLSKPSLTYEPSMLKSEKKNDERSMRYPNADLGLTKYYPSPPAYPKTTYCVPEYSSSKTNYEPQKRSTNEYSVPIVINTERKKTFWESTKETVGKVFGAIQKFAGPVLSIITTIAGIVCMCC